MKLIFSIKASFKIKAKQISHTWKTKDKSLLFALIKIVKSTDLA